VHVVHPVVPGQRAPELGPERVIGFIRKAKHLDSEPAEVDAKEVVVRRKVRRKVYMVHRFIPLAARIVTDL
jgi:hypothetical protein